MDGANGFVINGIDTADLAGFSVSNAGDVDRDGLDDILIGAPFADPNGNNGAGEVYVIFGSIAPFTSPFDLSSLDGTNGFVINGIDTDELAGTSVSNAGDVNGDGVDDILIGAPSADRNGNNEPGEAYIIFGSNAPFTSPFTSPFDLSSLDGTNGFVINGIDTDNFAGVSVSNAGDVNGDGFDDIIVGAPLTPGGVGQAYVIFGSNAGFSSSLDLSSLDGTQGIIVNGIGSAGTGQSVSAAGDMNGDGLDDFVIGAPRDAAGIVYVVFGCSSSAQG